MNKSKFKIIAGPCVVESKDLLIEVAEKLISICNKFENIEFIFKSSYKKANRTSISSFTGIGDKTALEYLNFIKEKYSIQVLTDVHSVEEVKIASEFVDILQIPAFLSRQTELIIAAAETGKIINIKKAQFMAAEDMQKASDKASSNGNNKIWLTERGTFFGYHDLVVDFRSMLKMKQYGYPVIFDATHSVQQPSIGSQSGGLREFIIPLAKAAAAIGVDGIFFETHPQPEKALSDAATQLPLAQAEELIAKIIKIININSI